MYALFLLDTFKRAKSIWKICNVPSLVLNKNNLDRIQIKKETENQAFHVSRASVA